MNDKNLTDDALRDLYAQVREALVDARVDAEDEIRMLDERVMSRSRDALLQHLKSVTCPPHMQATDVDTHAVAG